MVAGLFECDHVRPEYRERFGDYSDMFTQLFPELDWKYYDVCNGQFPENLDECDVYFATGSHRSVYEGERWIEQLKDTIRLIAATGKYFVGFCFGHQLLGEAMGGTVRKSPVGWCVGAHEFRILEQEVWMVPKRESINLLMMCQDQVLELPPGAQLLAESSKCPVAIFRQGDTLLGIQAHPEFSKAYDRLLMEGRSERIGAQVVQTGIQSLEQDIHQEIICSWILRFIGFRE